MLHFSKKTTHQTTAILPRTLINFDCLTCLAFCLVNLSLTDIVDKFSFTKNALCCQCTIVWFARSLREKGEKDVRKQVRAWTNGFACDRHYPWLLKECKEKSRETKKIVNATQIEMMWWLFLRWHKNLVYSTASFILFFNITFDYLMFLDNLGYYTTFFVECDGLLCMSV